MEQLLIRGGFVYTNGAVEQTDVLCRNGRIETIGHFEAVPENTAVLEAAGSRVIPGLIDVHTHGAVHVDVNAAGVEGLRRLAAFFAAQGVTSFHVSVLTDTPEVTEQCLRDAQTVMGDNGLGARLMGVHLEGPFLSSQYKGAMPEYLLREGDAALVRSWLQKYPGVIRYMTVSPEVPGVIDMIRELSEEIVIAIGHSGADYDTARAAIEAGARCVTHTFNAMRLFHQHEPAIMGAALESDCWCEAICDGRHLHPGTVRMLLKCKGYDRVMAVTDSIMAAGLPDGKYKLGVNDVTVKDGDARLTETDVRAGSTLTAAQGLRNLLRFTGEPLEKVLPILTANPAEAMRLGDCRGKIKQGFDADLVLLDEAMEVTATIVGGKTVWQKK